MKSGLSRRSFIKRTGLSARALALVDKKAHSFEQIQATDKADTYLSSVATVCNMCRARCHLSAKVSNGHLHKIEGNSSSPVKLESTWGSGS